MHTIRQRYIRTCQACGHEAEYKPVEEYKGESWQDTKCRKCKSEALDYGSWREDDMRESEKKLKDYSNITLAEFAKFVAELVQDVDTKAISLSNAISAVVLKSEEL